ncbi:hypothetical protein GPOL_c02520 [Gordonia polyisoprenivorans VH2]|uniref:Uncharacterized protein n=1 Tax=Gordonia polyisoprenivorans (strain DSM 44266 / VH2) TaxID=1112204 RepID=H6MS67_GORPV|nr:hypothetical protein GPOL_c02520 [Gordonia polyisoprenivorans VH2]
MRESGRRSGAYGHDAGPVVGVDTGTSTAGLGDPLTVDDRHPQGDRRSTLLAGDRRRLGDAARDQLVRQGFQCGQVVVGAFGDTSHHRRPIIRGMVEETVGHHDCVEDEHGERRRRPVGHMTQCACRDRSVHEDVVTVAGEEQRHRPRPPVDDGREGSDEDRIEDVVEQRAVATASRLAAQSRQFGGFIGVRGGLGHEGMVRVARPPGNRFPFPRKCGPDLSALVRSFGGDREPLRKAPSWPAPTPPSPSPSMSPARRPTS